MDYGDFVRRQINIRIVAGIVIVLLLAWCYSIGNRVFSLWHGLARASSRLERVDTTLAPGSRVEFDGTRIADLRTTGHLGPASSHPDIDTVALLQRWGALTAFIQRDSARFSKDRNGPTPGIATAERFLLSSEDGDLYLGEFISGADTARLAHDSTMYATIDSSTGPIVLRLHPGPSPSGRVRGQLLIGPPTALFQVY
jgi:hypothetical protein